MGKTPVLAAALAVLLAGGIHLKLDPYGGELFRFDKAKLPLRKKVTP